MTQCLYDCRIMHARLHPKKNKFVHGTFMFYLDLDELENNSKKLKLFGYGRKGLYSIHDDDYLPGYTGSLKERARKYLATQGVDLGSGKIMLLSNLRIFGYVFNPVSFYFCFDTSGAAQVVIAEVGNTFLEHKPYLIHKSQDGSFKSRQSKEFYVSPFSNLDFEFSFNIEQPQSELKVCIDEFDGEQPIICTSLSGKQIELSDSNLIKLTFKYPLVTLRVITLIHFHALILFLKGLPFRQKEDDLEKQRGVLNPRLSRSKTVAPTQVKKT